jgi:MFS family permease
MGFIADAVGRQNTLVLGVLGSTMSVVAFWLTSAYDDDTGLWLAFVVLHGFFAAGELAFFHPHMYNLLMTVKATMRSSRQPRSKSSARTHMPLSTAFYTSSEDSDHSSARQWVARLWLLMAHGLRHTST